MQSDLDTGDTDIQCLCCLANREFFHIAQKENLAIDIRQLLNRRRMAAWEADWIVTAPAWNRQRW